MIVFPARRDDAITHNSFFFCVAMTQPIVFKLFIRLNSFSVIGIFGAQRSPLFLSF